MTRRLADERGIALVMALGILVVLSITAISVLAYTGDNMRTARYLSARVTAGTLAEAGVNEALAVLNLSTNNALDGDLLPTTTTPFDGGTAQWSGTLDDAAGTWTITSTGTVDSPSGASPVAKTLTAHVSVVPSLSQTVNNPAWNYIYSRKPNDGNPDTCEMTITNSVQVSTPLFVEGDLCINQTAGVKQGPHGTTLVVKGRLHLANKNQNFVGTASAPVSEVYVGNGCVISGYPLHASPCSTADNVFASQYDTVQPDLGEAPVADWDSWYNASAPGPAFPCVPEKSSAPSTWPTFDGDTARNNSVAPAVNLTPLTGYDCWTAGGELAWNPSTRVLTVNGTVFIDGSAYIQNDVKPAVFSYSGMGTLYLSGTFLLKNATLCAVLLADASGCDTANWDPNVKSLIIVTNHYGDNGLPSSDGIQLVSAYLQGGVYATYDIDIDTSSSIDGPIVGNVINLGQSVNTSFPFISFVPNGAPGGQVVYAQALAPTYLDG